MFNSALVYEPACSNRLRTRASGSEPDDEAFVEAYRLLRFLRLVNALLQTTSVPPTPSCGKFIGHSSF
jgi:hypothetical protein